MKTAAFSARSLSPCEAKGRSEFRHTPARPGKLLTVHYSPLPPHHPLLVTTALHCKVSDKLIRLTYFDVGRRNIRGIVRTHLQLNTSSSQRRQRGAPRSGDMLKSDT